MSFLKDYFKFPKKERRGIFLLLTLIILVIVANQFIDHFIPSTQFSDESFQKEVEATYTIFKSEKRPSMSSNKRKAGNELFFFDPNTLNKKGWVKLGLTNKQAEVVINYRKKGGKFFVKKDVEKMYTISPQLFLKIKNYIRIDSALLKNNHQYSKNRFHLSCIIDINRGDSSAFRKLKGIGAVLSARIVKYRKKLGGFYSIEQLGEVYGLEKEVIDQNNNCLTINDLDAAIKKIDLNSTNIEQLKKHPYINWSVANSIIKMRKHKIKYSDTEELKESHLINDSLYNKISPYISL